MAWAAIRPARVLAAALLAAAAGGAGSAPAESPLLRVFAAASLTEIVAGLAESIGISAPPMPVASS